ncbi:MAG: glycoside hydrolase family 3 C-terminal domain-containing protein [Clostridia bacterium]|nr:glycoside hydrolase family 3 C-terminal domain-containing protein [Clostridia bacterium]
MLKYNEIIEKLTVKQKISLLTDIKSFASPTMNELGVPYVSMTSLSALMTGREGLTPSRLANSWDPQLVKAIVRNSLAKESENGANLIVAPSPKINFDPYCEVLGEDPYLTGALGRAYVEGIREGGAYPCIDGFYLTGREASFLDNNVDNRSLEELFVRPFSTAYGEAEKCSIITSTASLKDSYKTINKDALSYNRYIGSAYLMCKPDTSEEAMEAIKDKKVVISGSATALEMAYEKYLYTVKSIEDESATPEELDKAISDGSAVSEDMINNALDRVLDMAFNISCVKKTDNDISSVDRLKAITDTYVLLKNENNILPIAANKKIAIIGDIAMAKDADGITFADNLVNALERECVGMCKGYDINLVRNTENMNEVKEIAAKSDTVIVFLGFMAQMHSTNSLKLPASQLALLNTLQSYKDKVVCILDSAHTVDVSFDASVSGLMLANVGQGLSAEALSSVLKGNVSPSGKLTVSYYDDADEYFSALKKYKNAGKNKVGLFMGYRYYDSSKLKVKYPFGHGLGYSSISYSGIFVSGNKVSFRIKNTGSYDQTEITQIYVGRSNESGTRPEKELVSFVKTQLKAGEDKTVTVENIDLKVFNSESSKWVTEGGEYTVYVGASVSDIRLKANIKLEGEKSADSGKRSDYLQSDTNIVSEKFTLEAGVNKMKKFWKLKLVGTIVFLAALALVVYAFLMDKIMDPIILGATGALLALAIVLFIVSAVKKKSYKRKVAETEKEYKEQFLSSAEEKEYNSIDELFVAEFDAEENQAEEKKDDNVFWDDNSKYIDLSLTTDTVIEQIGLFLKERGMEIAPVECAKLVSAFASSRLIISGLSDTDELLSSVSEYFGTPYYCESLNNNAEGDLLYRMNDNGVRAPTALVNAIALAKENKEKIYTVVFKNVLAKDIFELLLPYLRYFSNPLRKCKVTVKAPQVSVVLPENLWIAIELAKGESLTDVAQGVLKTATVLNVAYTKCEISEEKNVYKPLGYYQIDYLTQQCRNKFSMKEELWKKIDGLEAYTNTHDTYSIGNKQWLQMEKYLSVLSVIEKEDYVALDIAMSYNLLPEIMAVLKGKIKTGEKDLTEELEQLFGEDKISMCRKMLKSATSSEF